MSLPARKKVLVYRIGSLGDTIVALPGYNKVVEVFPDAEIILLTNRPPDAKAAPAETVLGQNYFFHRVINYPTGTRNPLVLLKLIRELRALKIDTAINLATTRIMKDLPSTKRAVLRDRFFFKAAGIKKLIGFPVIDADFILTTDPETGNQEWETKRLVRRLKELGPIDINDDKYWDMHFSAQELAAADEVLSNLDINRPVIAASTGTKRPANDWEANNWTTLFAELKSELPGWQLVMLGSTDEWERADLCLQAWGEDGVNLCGKTSPRVSGAVLQRAKVFVGHDSGPMHLSAAVGTPGVAIYSARNLPGHWFPRGDFNKIIYHKVDCAGCHLEVCIEQKKKCILSVTVAEVKAALWQILIRDGLAVRAPDGNEQ